jgi:hypothetical protein
MWGRKTVIKPAETSGWSAEQIARCEGLKSLSFELLSFWATTIVEANHRSELTRGVAAESEGVCTLLRAPVRLTIRRDYERSPEIEPGAGILSFSSTIYGRNRVPWTTEDESAESYRPLIELHVFDTGDVLLRAVRSCFAARAAGGSKPEISVWFREPLRQPFGTVAPGEPVIQSRSGFSLATLRIYESWGEQSEL